MSKVEQFILIKSFQSGKISPGDSNRGDRLIYINRNLISEVSDIEEFASIKFFTITMNNGNMYYLRPEVYSNFLSHFGY